MKTNSPMFAARKKGSLGVKNGSLGTIERIESGVLQVKLDGTSEARVAVDTKFYKHLDHGYAATVHKAQGTTVDRSYILATPHFDRHTAYVALSRHCDAATVYYATDDFGGRTARVIPDTVRARFAEALSRARPKELAHDYLERGAGAPAAMVSRLVVAEWERSRTVNPADPTGHRAGSNEIDARAGLRPYSDPKPRIPKRSRTAP